MPRRRNEETVAKIMDASWMLFNEKGYAGTSYSDISAATGITRSLVQRYFPKKELLAQKNLARLRYCADMRARPFLSEGEDTVAWEYVTGQIYISALLSCEESRRLSCDVMRDRSTTSKIILSDARWSMRRLQDRANDDIDEQLLQDVTVVMGGLYEIIFYSATTGRPIDIARYMKPTIRLIELLRGSVHDEESLHRIYVDHAIEPSRLASVGLATYHDALETPWRAEFDR